MASQGMWLVSLLVILSHGAGKNLTLGRQLCEAVLKDENYTEVVQLLESGADTEWQCCCGGGWYDGKDWVLGATALVHAAEKGRVRISEVLLEHGADPEARDYYYGGTALHWAARQGSVRISEVLLEHGADLEARDHDGRTALHWAARQGISEALLEHGADLEARDYYGRTALHWAVRQGSVRILEALLEHGADLEARTNRGNTALHFAARGGHLAMVKLLVVNNSMDPLATNNEMETPSELAWRDEMAAWLRTNGGAEPTPTSWESWQHALRFHPREVAACVGVSVLLAGFKTTLEWIHSHRAIAAQDPSPALVGELVPSTGALRLAAKSITKDHRFGSLLEPMKLLANSFAVLASLLVVCGPCMWFVKPIYVAMVAGPAFLVRG